MNAAKSALPRIALPLSAASALVLVLAYLVPGLVGHDPWKSEDAIGIGIVTQMLHHGRVWLPYLAGEPWLEEGPLYYWLAAFTAKLLSPWFALHDGARIASGISVAAAFALVALAGREFYGRTQGAAALLALLGSLGLLVHAHEVLAENLMLAGQALAWYALAIAPRRAWSGGVLLGFALAIALLGKGLAAALLPAATALAAPAVSDTWRRRSYGVALGVAAILCAAFALGWYDAARAHAPAAARAWWHAQLAAFAWPPIPALGDWAETLAWSAWPAWPIALWTLVERRHRRWEPATRLLVVATLVALVLVLCRRDRSEVNALALLTPLALLAGASAAELRRGAANALAWFGAMSAALFGGLVWLGWIAMMTGVPHTIARNFAKLEPGFVPEFSWPGFLVAAALSLAWFALIARSERSALRGVTFWAAGVALLWGLLMTLWLPWIDYGKSYRPVAEELKAALPAHAGCIASRGLGESQRAVFDYHAGIVTKRLERGGAGSCRLLLVQSHVGESETPGAGWVLLWEGSRPRDRERYRLYEKR